MNDALHVCRVCGLFYPDYFPWGEDGRSPSFDICFCCGAEFGYYDCQPSTIEKHRAQWIKRGCLWHEPKQKPADWTWEKQRRNLEIVATLNLSPLNLTPTSTSPVRLGDVFHLVQTKLLERN